VHGKQLVSYELKTPTLKREIVRVGNGEKIEFQN